MQLAILIFIILVGFFLRVINLDQSLWLDEAISTLAVKENSLNNLVTQFLLGDFHPPFYYIILWLWTRIFGFSEVAVRSPSVIFGILSIFITYFIGKKLFDQKVALIAALLMAVSPLLIYYSQEARMYSLNIFVVLCSMYFFVNLVQEKKSKINLIGLVLSNVAVFYADYINYLIFPAQFIYLLMCNRKLVSKYLSLLVFSFVFLIPWLPVFMTQLEVGRETSRVLPQWSNIVGNASIKEVGLLVSKTIIGRISFENNLIYGSIVGIGAIFYGSLIVLSFKKINDNFKLVILWLIIPIILAFVISFYIPIFSYFRMIFVIPAFCLLLARGISFLPKNATIEILIMIVLLNLGFISYFISSPQFHREDWKSASKNIENQLNDNSLVLFENNTIPFVYRYYAHQVGKSQPGLNNIPAKSIDDVIDLSSFHNINKIFVFEYLVDITDKNRLLERQINKVGYRKDFIINFNGVGFINVYIRPKE